MVRSRRSSQLHSEFGDSLRYMRQCLKNVTEWWFIVSEQCWVGRTILKLILGLYSRAFAFSSGKVE